MAWSGFREPAAESGLELSLGLPAYFSKQPSGRAAGLDGKEESSVAGDFALQPNGSNNGKNKASRPVAAAPPVVGWPPVRSFRRNLASKPSTQSSSQDGRTSKDDSAAKARGAGAEHGGRKGPFVKINMDGVPIGRKVDLRAHGGYGELSGAVDRLFQGLLAAQRDHPAMTIAAAGQSCDGEKHAAITGLLDGSGEYTLVYEDDEGDQMLVGDVPWDMFIATAKRLRVLRSSDLNSSSLRAAVSRKRAAAEC